MPSARKPDPEKYCAACQTRLSRVRYNGALETMNSFLRRKYCNRTCMAAGQVREVVTSLSHSRMKARRQGKEACEACGRASRLHVHHRDENPLNNTPGNLQTLCVSCHRRTHSPNFAGTPTQRKHCLHCSKGAVKIGLCNTHLTRLKRYGDPCLKKLRMGSEWVLTRASG